MLAVQSYHIFQSYPVLRCVLSNLTKTSDHEQSIGGRTKRVFCQNIFSNDMKCAVHVVWYPLSIVQKLLDDIIVLRGGSLRFFLNLAFVTVRPVSFIASFGFTGDH